MLARKVALINWDGSDTDTKQLFTVVEVTSGGWKFTVPWSDNKFRLDEALPVKTSKSNFVALLVYSGKRFFVCLQRQTGKPFCS